MAYSIPSADLPKSVSDAVRKLRKHFGETQQQFAYRMKTAIRTVARYETVHPPKGKVLRRLALMATENDLDHLAEVFRRALSQELGVKHAEKVRINHLADLYEVGQIPTGYEKYMKAINGIGSTVNAIRVEFDASDGTTFVMDVAPPELQKVLGPDGKKVKKKVPRKHETGPSTTLVLFEEL